MEEGKGFFLGYVFFNGAVEEGRCADVVGVMVAVDQVGDCLVGHALDGCEEVVSKGGWRVDQDDSVGAD